MPVMGVMGEWMAKTGAPLLRRRNYQDFAGFWPQPEGTIPSRRCSTTSRSTLHQRRWESLPRSNSTLPEGDAVEAVARLKEQLARSPRTSSTSAGAASSRRPISIAVLAVGYLIFNEDYTTRLGR